MLGQLGIIIVAFADNIMVGQHSMEELAAASFVNNFFTLASIFGIGFSYGLTPIISGFTARKESSHAGAMLKNSLLSNLLISAGLVIAMTILILNLHNLNQPKELIPLIVPYYLLQLASIPFVMLFNAFKQFSDGTGDTVTPMWIILGTNVINIIGNYLFIYGNFGCPEMGLTGAGIVTLAIRILSPLVFCLLFVFHSRYREFRIGFKESFINRKSQRLLFRMGIPVGIQMGVESASFSLSVLMMGWIGSIALAAHQIVGVVSTIGFMIYYGIGAAVAIRISSYKGQNDMTNVRRSAFAGLHIMMLVALSVMLIIFICRNFMGYLFTDNEEVIKMVALLAYPVILYQIGDGLQILFANALRGISDVKFLACSAFACHFGMALPIGYFCGFILNWGPLGIWSGFPVSLTALGLSLWYRFNKNTKLCVKKD
jgi:putative efflux protein, MATE family